MLTRIEIDGFKSFTNFSMEFSPLTIVAGLNASGKSNLFDALHLLSLLAEHDLNTAFDKVQRGRNLELFTQYADGRYAEEMRFAVEMFLNEGVVFLEKDTNLLGARRVRYEVAVRRRTSISKVDVLTVEDEAVGVLPEYKLTIEEIEELKRNSTTVSYWNGQAMMLKIGGRANRTDTIFSLYNKREWKGTDQSFYVLHQEFLSWKLLHLDPKKLPTASPRQAFGLPGTLNPAADNLAGVLFRLSKTDPYLLTRIAQRLASLVPGIKEIVVKHDDYFNQYRVFVLTTNEQRFPLHLLSEGTLRLLALCTLAFDDQQHGVLGLEEPENGVHPGLLKRVAELLRDLSTNEAPEEGQEPWPLRQVIVNTHSPGLIKACLEAAAGQEGGIKASGLSLWFSQLVGRSAEENGKRVMRRVTDMLPVELPEDGVLPAESVKRVALAQLVNFLESANPDDLLGTLGLQAVADAR